MNQKTEVLLSRMMWFVGVGLFCLGLFGPSVPAQASIVLQLSDQEMTTQAHRIVRGKVVRKYSVWEKADRRIYTYVTIAVLDMIKGIANTSEVVIRQVGGTANGLGMHVPGTASFKLGEEVLVFLEKSRDSSHHLVMGMSYGKYQVVTDAKTQVRTLHRDLHGVSLAKWNEEKKMQIQHASPQMTKPVQMEEFVQKIRQYVQKGTVHPTVKSSVPSAVRTIVRPVIPTPVRPFVPKPAGTPAPITPQR